MKKTCVHHHRSSYPVISSNRIVTFCYVAAVKSSFSCCLFFVVFIRIEKDDNPDAIS